MGASGQRATGASLSCAASGSIVGQGGSAGFFFVFCALLEVAFKPSWFVISYRSISKGGKIVLVDLHVDTTLVLESRRVLKFNIAKIIRLAASG